MLAIPNKRPAPTPSIQSMRVSAPVGGMNALAAATSLPEGDCLYLYNMTQAELGLRVRLGWSEYAIGLTGASDTLVRTVMPFSGSHKNGSTDKLFATTSSGIWDVSVQGAVTSNWVGNTAYVTGSTTQAASFVFNAGNVYVCVQSGTSAPGVGGPLGTGTGIVDGTCVWNFVSSNTAPTKLVSFGTTTGDAGYGTYTVMSTPGGRFLIYCDEENGMYVWAEGGAWTKTNSDTQAPWTASTLYVVNDLVLNGTNVYKCTTGGTSATSGGPTGTGGAITDGTVVWAYQHGVAATAIGPSIADQRAGFTALPANFAAVCVWKSKVWLVEKDTSRAWWLPTNSVYGVATSQDFGGKMRSGGPLVNLYNWSYDAGLGLDTLLVGLSTAGDVVVYVGTDPSSANTFGLKGSWSVGGVPYGRRIATEHGGELLIMSLRGVVELSKLVVGAPATVGGNRLYASDKIAPLFNLDAQTYYSNKGWQIAVNPGDNTVMCLVPANGTGSAAKPWVMAQSNASWSIYRDLPITCMGTWNGTTYFGTPDGRVAKVGGYVDGVLFGNTSSYSAINWSVLTGFTDGGTLNVKQVLTLQPLLEAQESGPPVNAQAFYDLNISEAATPTTSSQSSSNSWDTAQWDLSTWGGSYNEVTPVIGAYGMGRTVAVGVRGLASSRTSLLGVGVMYRVGGLF